jgi:hypothetical protein
MIYLAILVTVNLSCSLRYKPTKLYNDLSHDAEQVLDAEAMILVRLVDTKSNQELQVIGQCLIVIDQLRRVAVPEVFFFHLNVR